MTGFRVTKYDPALCSPNGAYTGDDWTSVSDIGRTFGGQTLTCSEYLRAETSYVLAVRSFLEASHVKTLRVTDLQMNEIDPRVIPPELADETWKQAATVVEGIVVSGPDLDWLVRLALREALWCRLEGDHGFHVHFGYDYYMYVGSEELDPAPPPMPPGIFAEPFDSPYRREPPDEEDVEGRCAT